MNHLFKFVIEITRPIWELAAAILLLGMLIIFTPLWLAVWCANVWADTK